MKKGQYFIKPWLFNSLLGTPQEQQHLSQATGDWAHVKCPFLILEFYSFSINSGNYLHYCFRIFPTKKVNVLQKKSSSSKVQLLSLPHHYPCCTGNTHGTITLPGRAAFQIGSLAHHWKFMNTTVSWNSAKVEVQLKMKKKKRPIFKWMTFS